MWRDDPPEYDWSENKVLGHGSFGTVYVGHMKSGEEVAVKVCKGKNHFDIWKAEVDVLLACVDATNIVQIRSFKEESMALEIADSTLDDLVKNSVVNIRGLSQSAVGDLILDLTTAVSFLQNKNIAHRDIKPGNILVFRKPRRESGYLFKLGDMGTSTAKNSNETLVGTYAFLVPTFCKALAEGRRPFEKVQSSMSGLTIDAWTIGCTVFYASTSLYPFRVENSNNPHEAVEQIKLGDITVVKKGNEVVRSKNLPQHRFEKWYAYAVSRYILHCLEVYLRTPTDDVCSSLTNMVRTMRNAVEAKFIGLKNRTFFRYADISGDHEYLQAGYPSLGEVYGTSNLSNIKLLSEDGVIEGSKVKVKTLPTDVVHFIVSSEKMVNEPPFNVSAAFNALLSDPTKLRDPSAWFLFCNKEYHRAQRELEFMRKSIEAMKRIKTRVLNEGMTIYKLSENTLEIINTFGKICSSALFKRNEFETLQYFELSALPNTTLHNDIEQLMVSMKSLNDASPVFTTYEDFLADVDIDIDSLDKYINPFRSSSQFRSNTTYTRESIETLCERMNNIYLQSSMLQKLLISHAEICVTIFNSMARIKGIHRELVELSNQHQLKVKNKLDEIHQNINALKTKPIEPDVIQELNVIAVRLKELVKNQN